MGLAQAIKFENDSHRSMQKFEDQRMTAKLAALIEMARSVLMTPSDSEQQRRGFAYGNKKIENDRITRKMVDECAEALKRSDE
jgi:hypothetical protein